MSTDKQLPFLEKVRKVNKDLVSGSVKTLSVKEKQEIVDWTISNMLRLAKQPRIEVYGDPSLWTFLGDLLLECFPVDEPVMISDDVKWFSRVRIDHAMLPILSAYLQVASNPSFEYIRTLHIICKLYTNGHVTLCHQLNNLVDFCKRVASALDYKTKIHNECTQMLVLYHKRSCLGNRKAFQTLVENLPFLLCADKSVPCEYDDLIDLILREGCDSSTHTLSSQLVHVVKQLRDAFITLFYQKYVEALAHLPLDTKRQVGFALFKDLDNNTSVLPLLDSLNVYVHKNDQIYREQSDHLLANVLPGADCETLIRLVSLDYYLVCEHLKVVDPQSLNDSKVQTALYAGAVKGRVLSELIMNLRRIKGVECAKDVFFKALTSDCDRHYLKHVHEESNSITDGYTTVLEYILHGNTAHVEDPNGLRMVPRMEKCEFKAYLAVAKHEDILLMLRSSLFYELHELKKPFERWLVGEQNLDHLREYIALIPHEYLKDSTIIALRHVDTISRIVRKRPRAIEKLTRILFECSGKLSNAVVTIIARYNTKRDDRFEVVAKLAGDYLDILLDCTPNFTYSDIVLSRYAPGCWNEKRFARWVRDRQDLEKCPFLSVSLVPHFSGISLEAIDSLETLTTEFPKYPYAAQLEFLRLLHGTAISTNTLLHWLRTPTARQSVIDWLVDSAPSSSRSTEVILQLVAMVKHVPHVQVHPMLFNGHGHDLLPGHCASAQAVISELTRYRLREIYANPYHTYAYAKLLRGTGTPGKTPTIDNRIVAMIRKSRPPRDLFKLIS